MERNYQISLVLPQIMDTSQIPMKIEKHPELGDIRVYDKSWSANVTLPSVGEVEVEGAGACKGAASPTQAELEEFENVRKNLPKFLEQSRTAIAICLDMARPSLQTTELKLTSICVSSAPGCFTLHFELTNASSRESVEFYADFDNSELVEADFLH